MKLDTLSACCPKATSTAPWMRLPLEGSPQVMPVCLVWVRQCCCSSWLEPLPLPAPFRHSLPPRPQELAIQPLHPQAAQDRRQLSLLPQRPGQRFPCINHMTRYPIIDGPNAVRCIQYEMQHQIRQMKPPGTSNREKTFPRPRKRKLLPEARVKATGC